ncbi:hypothetical protein AT984_04555 [Paucibacter sp. KCTC 42545]|nr:hypothetical protein AT984_04555 [Paucibacter sp. KCTC 42545]
MRHRVIARGHIHQAKATSKNQPLHSATSKVQRPAFFAALKGGRRPQIGRSKKQSRATPAFQQIKPIDKQP